ncbi:hypothetical protein RHMOL_Rhmol01G0110000 [Rhododendron molle]|uniref:Uncharacterized protein n=1 Tax=Rhododendron molle TaxID=49168 RepID=A0ACC0Q0R4_RHOML|nr:hypothetical protein RHMOL_Rhmol01G0110000 [Rhododendron molle]
MQRPFEPNLELSQIEVTNGFYIQMYMPGLAKENMYNTGEHNNIIIREVSSNEGRVWRISTTIDLPLKFYKSDQIKIEMKNGVLNIVVLKYKKPLELQKSIASK